jgi:arsenate reductase
MVRVLFACVQNAGRSQMAAAWFNALADRNRAEAASAGTQPAAAVHPEVVSVMREVGIDLSQVKPQLLDDQAAKGAQVLVTMGCGEACPLVPGAERIEWSLTDPHGQSLSVVRALRDEIKQRVIELLRSRGLHRTTASPGA